MKIQPRVKLNGRSGYLFCLLLFLLTACTELGGAAVSPQASDTPSGELIVVAAAADLQFAFQDIAELYEQETGEQVRLVFGSTGLLTQQIEHGAPYDLIAAANTEYIDRLSDQDLVLMDSIALYARGRVVLASNQNAGVTANELSDLLDPAIRQIAIANPEHAPYGAAAQQALQSAGVWDQIQNKLVRGENVRQALQYVQSGDAQVGILALSVVNVPDIRWTLIDEGLHEPLDQALAVLASSRYPELARQFAGFINGESGRTVMRQYGFLLPGDPVVHASAPNTGSEGK